MKFLTCPRCGDLSYETLRSYSHCVLCSYSPTFGEMERETEALKAACKYISARETTLDRPESKVPITPMFPITRNRNFAVVKGAV